MERKSKLILSILIILFIILSIPVTIFLVRQRQEIRERAAVPEGEATVGLSPEIATHPVGESFPVQVKFNTNNITISGIAVRLSYSYSGTEPEAKVENNQIQIASEIASSPDWNCPIRTVTPQTGIINIDIACINTSITGFSTTTDILLATFNLIAESVPAINPVVLRFDPNQSIITRKADGQDILLIPTSTGQYTITSGATPTPTPTSSPTETPTPTPGEGTPTPTPTGGVGGPETTATPTPTPTTAAGTTPTPTPTVSAEELPETGIFTSTLLFLIGGGTLLTLGFLRLLLY